MQVNGNLSASWKGKSLAAATERAQRNAHIVYIANGEPVKAKERQELLSGVHAYYCFKILPLELDTTPTGLIQRH